MKTIQHTINGELLTLDVGKMWFSKYFGEATKSDPILDFKELITNLTKQFDFVCALIYAGVNCHNKATGKEFITLETAEQWAGNMEEGEASELITKYFKLFATGEEKAQPESPSAGTN